MTPHAAEPPDLAPIARHLRSMYGSRLLIAAVNHFQLFEQFDGSAVPHAKLAARIGLKPRPAMVLFPALCAMGFLRRDAAGNLSLSETGRHLRASAQPTMAGYAGLERDDAGTAELVKLLRNDGPENSSGGLAYVKDDDAPSPMDDPDLARHLTLALAGRAHHIAPIAAAAITRRDGHLLDIAAGSGCYTFEWLRLNTASTATVFDRPHVLTVANEQLDEFCASGRDGAQGVRSRVRFVPGDMLRDELPPADLVFAFSLFHDWGDETCALLARRFADALRPGGELWVHDVFLDESLDGPLHACDYSAALFSITKGRIYSRSEHREWHTRAGLTATPAALPTRMDYSLISFRKP